MKQTSREAHEAIKSHKPAIHRKILAALTEIKKGSFRDIATYSRLKEMQVWKRLSELRNDNKVKEAGVKRCQESGRNVTIWEMVK